MTTKDLVTHWGCIVCANVHFAAGGLKGIAIGACWLAFGLVLMVAIKMEKRESEGGTNG